MVLGLVFSFITSFSQAFGFNLIGCKYNKECVRELPGALCGDGTKAYFTVTLREGADSLIVYLNGGGACWSEATCTNTQFVTTISRPKASNDWTHGQGLWNSKDKENPFASHYNIISVPYCTGDAHTGSKVQNYGTAEKPFIVHHQGYKNILLALNAAKHLFPHPRRAVFMGSSSGGIGVTYHLRNFVTAYPHVATYVINDGGTPFEPPFVNDKAYTHVLGSWGAYETFPEQFRESLSTFGQVWDFNRIQFPKVRFGFVHSYGDKVMTGFAQALGASTPLHAVRDMLVNASEKYMGNKTSNQKVFYLNDYDHVRLGTPLEKQNSAGKNLKVWVSEMVNDVAWDNVRPAIEIPLNAQ